MPHLFSYPSNTRVCKLWALFWQHFCSRETVLQSSSSASDAWQSLFIWLLADYLQSERLGAIGAQPIRPPLYWYLAEVMSNQSPTSALVYQFGWLGFDCGQRLLYIKLFIRLCTHSYSKSALNWDKWEDFAVQSRQGWERWEGRPSSAGDEHCLKWKDSERETRRETRREILKFLTFNK